MDTAVTAMYAWLARRTGLGRDDLVVDTGSGLSRRTAISSRQIVHVVRAATGIGDLDPVHVARRGPRWEAYRNSLAIGGRDGTLRHRFAHLDATVLGKTGTLRSAIALSGLLEVDPDRRVVFSIITNGHSPRRQAAIRRAQDRLVGVVTDYLRRRQ
jgi:D-alanyl-D-alanine carboxypeptidase/D-alanyl-D-alanine-endopeptidase (penicillin-binding protein 4)